MADPKAKIPMPMPSVSAKAAAPVEPKKRRPVRMPGPADVDKVTGLVRIQVVEKGVTKIKHVPAVDAREYILHDIGTLFIDSEVLKEEDKIAQQRAAFDSLGLEELRRLAEKHNLSWVGKNETALRAMLSEAGVEPFPAED